MRRQLTERTRLDSRVSEAKSWSLRSMLGYELNKDQIEHAEIFQNTGFLTKAA